MGAQKWPKFIVGETRLLATCFDFDGKLFERKFCFFFDGEGDLSVSW